MGLMAPSARYQLTLQFGITNPSGTCNWADAQFEARKATGLFENREKQSVKSSRTRALQL